MAETVGDIMIRITANGEQVNQEMAKIKAQVKQTVNDSYNTATNGAKKTENDVKNSAKNTSDSVSESGKKIQQEKFTFQDGYNKIWEGLWIILNFILIS